MIISEVAENFNISPRRVQTFETELTIITREVRHAVHYGTRTYINNDFFFFTVNWNKTNAIKFCTRKFVRFLKCSELMHQFVKMYSS